MKMKVIMEYSKFAKRPEEQERIDNLMAIIPTDRSTVLEIGARDGYISNLLPTIFETVTALDLEKPKISNTNVISVKGDVTHLEYSDNSFDVVLCSEVLEHIPSKYLVKACEEISRVAKYDVVIGVPYKQDIRVGRTTCLSCHRKCPPWGHVNVFNKSNIKKLFKTLRPTETKFVGKINSKTNFISTFFMDIGGNPWGAYEQEEGCVYCGKKLIAPTERKLLQKVFSKIAIKLNEIQKYFVCPQPGWMHIVFKKNRPA
jgi:hypothetical protein